MFVRTALAVAFGVPEAGVRVRAPFVGGAFGAGLRVWQRVFLAAIAARMVRRPVKLALTRAQMFHLCRLALDELAYELGTDPLELRLRNYADVHPHTGRPWTTKALRDCYEKGAERFGWALRTPGPRSMRDGRMLIGYGMASAHYGYVQAPCQARASLGRDGVAIVRSARDRHRTWHLHGDDTGGSRGPGTATGQGQVRARGHRDAAGAAAGRIGPYGGARQRGTCRVHPAGAGIPARRG